MAMLFAAPQIIVSCACPFPSMNVYMHDSVAGLIFRVLRGRIWKKAYPGLFLCHQKVVIL